MATKPAAAAPPTGSAAVTDETAPKSRKKLLLTIFALVVLVAGAAGGWYFWQASKAEAAPAKKTPPQTPLLFLALEPPFVANFEEGQAARFLQIDVRVASRCRTRQSRGERETACGVARDHPPDRQGSARRSQGGRVRAIRQLRDAVRDW